MKPKRRLLSLFTAVLLAMSLLAAMPVSALGDLGKIFWSGTNNTYFFWDDYPNASTYKVEITGSVLNKTYYVTNSKFEYGNIFTQKGRVYYIAVTALDSKGNALTTPCEALHIDTAEITGFKVSSDLTVSWNRFNGDLDEYTINITDPNGATGGVHADKNATSVNLREYLNSEPSGRYRIWMRANVKKFYSYTTAESKEIYIDYASPMKFVTSTKATVSPAVVGEHPSDTATFVLNDGALNANDSIEEYRVQWRDTSDNILKSTDVFEKGRTYKLIIIVSLKDGTYLHRDYNGSSIVNSSVNGTATSMINLGGYEVYELSIKVTPEEPPTPVKRVDLTVTAPKAGKNVNSAVKNPSEEVTVSKLARRPGTTRFVTVFNSGTWLQGSTVLAETDTFEDGKTYVLRVRLHAVNGYQLSKSTKVYVNGKQASTSATNFSGYVTYSVKFTVGGLKGDVNNDGSVDMLDLTTLQRQINGWDVTINETNADLTGDGNIDMFDLTSLQRLINSM